MFAVLTSFLASRFTIVSTQALFLRPEPAILSKAISIRILPVVLTVRIVSCRQCEQISSKWLIFRNNCLMPPWWVHQKTGAERPAAGRSGWVLIVWVSCQTVAITLHRKYCLVAHLSGASCVLRDGAEPASFPSWSGSHRLPVYPAGVRGVDLRVKVQIWV